jgi:hypothetical protein
MGNAARRLTMSSPGLIANDMIAAVTDEVDALEVDLPRWQQRDTSQYTLRSSGRVVALRNHAQTAIGGRRAQRGERVANDQVLNDTQRLGIEIGKPHALRHSLCSCNTQRV